MDWMQQLSQFHLQQRERYPDSPFRFLFHVRRDYSNLTAETVEMLRWFKLQELTSVGIYTSGEQEQAEEVLDEFNRRGYPVRCQIASTDIQITPESSGGIGIITLNHYRNLGEKVFGVMDYNRRNLESLAEQTSSENVLLLQHLATTEEFTAQESRIVQGHSIDLAHLISERGLPESIQYCWHGLNDPDNLDQFLHSSVPWGEVDVRRNPATGKLITRHDSFNKSPEFTGEQVQDFETTLRTLKENGRRVKVDFKQGRSVIGEVTEILHGIGFADDEIWFHGDIHKLYPRGFKQLRASFPGAILQTTIDGLGRFIVNRPGLAKGALNIYARWGVNRFLLTYNNLNLATIMDQMDDWEYEVNFYEIPDLRGFLRALLFMPTGITSDYNFPEWNRFGRGSGQDLKWHIYTGENN